MKVAKPYLITEENTPMSRFTTLSHFLALTTLVACDPSGPGGPDACEVESSRSTEVSAERAVLIEDNGTFAWELYHQVAGLAAGRRPLPHGARRGVRAAGRLVPAGRAVRAGAALGRGATGAHRPPGLVLPGAAPGVPLGPL